MKSFGVAVVVGLVAVVLVLLLLGWTGEGQSALRSEKAQIALEQQRALAPLWLAVKRVLVTALGVAGGSIAAILFVLAVTAVLSTPNLVRITWLRSWLVKPNRHALYPALAEPDGAGHVRVLTPVNERLAQPIAALVGNQVNRLGGAGQVVKQLTNPKADDFALSEPPGPATVTPQEVTSIDPQKAPHFLLLGETGCGKSTAVYAIADALRKTIPCQFLVLDREGPNWNEQAAAITVPGYLSALEKVEEERQRRARIMREADVDHVSKLPDQQLPYIVVILEEAESVYKAMTLHGRAQGIRYTAIVRDLASMGRKQGILLIVATQTGTSEVFDVPTRKNLNHKLFFRNEPAVGDAWGIPREIGLSRLPTGTAYSLNHGALVTFPHAGRPKLPRSPLYYEPRLALPADAEADGLEADDMADGVVVAPYASSGTVPEPQNGQVYPVEAPHPGRTVPVPVPPQRIDRRRPTPVEAAAMRAHYARTHSKTAVCMTFYGYKNGDCWEWVEMALKGEL